MATSGTYDFNLDINELIEDAFTLAGSEFKTGFQMRMAKRALNLLQLEWLNIGINLWQIDEVLWDSNGDGTGTTTLTAGTKTYNLRPNTGALLDVVVRTGTGTSQSDYYAERISRPEYSRFVSKEQQGRPHQYLYNRTEIKDFNAGSDQLSSVTLYPVPDRDSFYSMVYWRIERMPDSSGLPETTLGVPDRFLPALTYGMAMNISARSKEAESVARYPALKAEYNEKLEAAMNEDRDKSVLRLTPRVPRIG